MWFVEPTYLDNRKDRRHSPRTPWRYWLFFFRVRMRDRYEQRLLIERVAEVAEGKTREEADHELRRIIRAKGARLLSSTQANRLLDYYAHRDKSDRQFVIDLIQPRLKVPT